jgi:xylulokinase
MEGVSFVLRKNCEHIAGQGLKLTGIVATGGGAKSPVWCKLQADITGLPVHVPAEKEAACLGAAMIAAVSGGKFADLADAAKSCVAFAHTYEPEKQEMLEQKYRRFCALYEASLQIAKL